MTNLLKNKNVLCALGGAAAIVIGKKIISAKKTRQLAVTGLAKGMKLAHESKEVFQNMKENCTATPSGLRTLKNELNRFFKDSTCKEVLYTNNNDKMFFGMKTIAMIDADDIYEYLIDDEPVRIGKYIIEIDSHLLNPVLGIEDPKTDKRIDFVGGIRGLAELEKRVSEDCEVAFLMYPTSIGELFAVSDAGLLMPPKSTWFEPKLRFGFFIHSLED